MTEAERLGVLIASIVRDDAKVSAQMTLELAGHPKAQALNIGKGGDGLSDPTATTALTPNNNSQIEKDGRRWQYLRMAMLDAALEMDNMRARYTSPNINRPSIPESHRWCTNCIQYGRLAIAVTKRDYCWWCRDVRAETSHLPSRRQIEERPHAI